MSNNGGNDIYLLAGHSHAKRDAALEAVIAASGKPSPSVAYIGAASSDSVFFFKLMTKSLLDAGAGRVDFVKLSNKRANMDKAYRILETSDIIHMGGGDVEKGMSVLESRDIIRYLASLREKGKLFFGLSAGSIMLARSWVRWTDPKDDDSVELFQCMDFAHLFCDTHAESENFAELATLLSLVPGNVTGYGIPSGSGLKVTEKGKVSAIGKLVWRFRKKAGTVIRIEDLEAP
jgi:peptidase E